MTVAADRRASELLVLVTIGGRTFAWRVAGVAGVVPMAAITPLPGAPGSVVGVLNLHGETLVVVDPRPGLQLAPTLPHPTHHLLILTGLSRFLLWVDRAERIVGADEATLDPVSVDGGLVVARLNGGVIPLLDPRAFDPSPVPQDPVLEDPVLERRL